MPHHLQKVAGHPPLVCAHNAQAQMRSVEPRTELAVH